MLIKNALLVCLKDRWKIWQNSISIVFIVFLLPQWSLAANLTNHISGVGPENKIKPYICIQDGSGKITYALAPGQSVDGNKMSGNKYYVGATLRFDGCSTSNAYLGYIGFNLNSNGNNNIDTYSPPDGIHVAYEKGAIDSKGVVTGKINYTQIKANSNIHHAKAGKYWEFTGFNLSGLEFSKSIDPFVIPNLSEQDAETASSDLNEVNAFIQKGANTIRVPVRWGYLQLEGPGKGPIYKDYYEHYVRPLLQSLTQAKVHTIVDLHAYMRYSQFGSQYAGCGMDGPCPDGMLITDSKAYQDIWSKLYELIQNDPAIDKNYILLDLVNEPVEVPDDKVFTIQTDVVKMLRKKGFKGYILVEGNSWSGLHSWTTYEWQGGDGQSFTNATLFTRENFNKAGINDLSKILINVHQYLDSDFSGTKNECQQDMTTTGPEGFNLLAFTDYLEQNQLKAIVTEFGAGTHAESCTPALAFFMDYLKDHSAQGKNTGFMGWTIWSVGHGWGGYNLRVTADSYQEKILEQYS